MRCVNPLRDIRLDSDDTPRARIKIENSIIMYLAGPIAERRFKSRSFRHWHADDDHRRAVDLALRLCGHRESATAYLKWLEIRTKDLIDLRWQSVGRLAAGLLEKSTLKSDEILALIYPPEPGPGIVHTLSGEDASFRKKHEPTGGPGPTRSPPQLERHRSRAPGT
jgi:hypothetical protein